MGKRGWFGAVKKAFGSDKKHERAKRSRWMCRGTSSSLEEEEGTASVMAGESKLSEALDVPIKEVRIANHAQSLSPPAKQPDTPESEPATEVKPPESLSPRTEGIKVSNSISAAIKADTIFKTIEEQIKEANSFETVLIPIREEKAAQTKMDANAPQSMKADTIQEKLAEISFLPPLLVEETKLPETGDEQRKHAYSVAIATAVAAEAATAAAWAAVRAVRLERARVPWIHGKSKEELAAIKIQSVFRGYLARRSMRALRGLARLKSLVKGSATKRQAATALRCVQMMSKVRAQISSRRMKMSEENQALQHHRMLKQQKELECLKPSIGDGWDHSLKSKAQQAATLAHRQDAAMRREKALAYAFSHQQQWRNSIKSTTNPMIIDVSHPNWGWNWLERWMFARPWENRCVADRSDAAAVRTAIQCAGQIAAKSLTSRQKPTILAAAPVGTRKNLPPCTTSRPSPVGAKPATVSRRPWVPGGSSGEDSKNMIGMNSQGIRRHSLSSYSIRDVERNVSLSTLRSSSLSVKSTRDKSNSGSLTGSKPYTGEKTLDNWAKKRSSFSGPAVYGNSSWPCYQHL